MPNSYSNKEDQIVDAINAWNTGELRSIRAVAIDFDVDISTPQRRLAGRGLRISRSGPNKALSDEQELALYEYIVILDQAKQSARFSMVRGAANYLLREAYLDTSIPPPLTPARPGLNVSSIVILNFSSENKNLWPLSETRAQCKGHARVF